jgi:hypothetical protein
VVKTALRWIGRHLLWFVVIVAILAAFELFRRELAEFTASLEQAGRVRETRADLGSIFEQEARSAGGRVKALESAGRQRLEARIAELDAQINEIAAATSPPLQPVDIVTGKGVEKARSQLRREVLQQERKYLRELTSFSQALVDIESAKAEAERLRQEHAAVQAQLQQKVKQVEAFQERHRWARLVPFTESRDEWKSLQVEQEALIRKNDEAYQRYVSLWGHVNRMPSPKKPLPFLPEKSVLLAQIDSHVTQLKRQLEDNWVNKLSNPIGGVIPVALGILAGIILVPIFIQAFLYYLVAPLASRRPAIRLLPQGGGTIAAIEPISSISKSVEVGAGQELLIHPEYLQSSADAGTKQTKWLLDWSLPLSSLASGMVALTRIRSETPHTFVVSAMKDPLTELALLTLPEGSAIVLQPRSLVGVLRPIDRPVRITRHWRLGTLSAWLTLQFRYLVFHGPQTLIVRGCRGVRVEAAEGGRSINQEATMGFSANVGYSVRRNETFMPYLTGKQGLFNDNFAGDAGYYIYEEVPDASRRTGISGRGIEGVMDTLLKAFGI